MTSKGPLNIILVNYRYFISGGPERYMFNIKDVLEKNGHNVIPFSIQHNKNEPSVYSNYFMDAIGSGDEVFGHEYKRDIKTSIQVVKRIIYSYEAKSKLIRLIKDKRPDLVYILYFQNKMSCSVIDAVKKLNVPVVQRISDFAYMCQNQNSSLYLHSKGEICERCLNGSLMNTIRYKCSDGSYTHSIIKASSLFVMSFLNVKEKIDAFVFPSSFTMSKYIQFGVKADKAFFIPTFFNQALISNHQIQYENFAVYVGRLVPEKGLMTLIKAFENINYNLKIIGHSHDGLFESQLKEYLVNKRHNIEFLGELNFDEIQNYLSKCLFTIVPSEWYENLPNTVLESYAFKKCVVATNIGSLKEIVIDGVTGCLFEYKNYFSLREKIELLFSNVNLAKQYGANAFEKLTTIYSSETHYRNLITLFYKLISINKVF